MLTRNQVLQLLFYLLMAAVLLLSTRFRPEAINVGKTDGSFARLGS